MTARKDSPFGSSFVLDEIREFIDTIVWAPKEYLDTMTLALALSHVLGNPRGRKFLSSVPHILVTSKKAGVGKSTLAAQLPTLLGSRPWAVGKGTTEFALNSKFLTDGADILVADDIGKVFGDNGLAGKLSKLYDVLVKCYLRTGVISVSVNRVAKDLPVFAMAFMNGLEKAAADDLADRAICMPMPDKPARIRKMDALSPDIAREAQDLREDLHGWIGSQVDFIKVFLRDDARKVHPAMNDRVFQKWSGLFAVAHAAGGDWPQRCMDAFLLLALDSSQKPPVMRWQQCLLDAAAVITEAGTDRIFLADLIHGLRNLEEGEYYDEASTDYLVKRLLPKALGPPQAIRGRTRSGKAAVGQGWMAAPLLTAAAVLHDQVSARPAPGEPDEVEQALALRVVG